METKTWRKISVSKNHFETTSLITWTNIVNTSVFLWMHPLNSAVLGLCLTKPLSTGWKPTCWEEALGFALRTATATPNLAPWVCPHQKPSVKLWDSLCWYGFQLGSCNDVAFPALSLISLKDMRTVPPPSPRPPPGACEGQTGPGGLFPQFIHPRTEAQNQTSAAKPGLLPNFQPRAETHSEKRGEEY